VARGGTLYERYCARCHSPEAQSPNIVTDLRRSAALPSKEAWTAIVHDGAFKAMGMVGWSQFLSLDEVDMIRGYVSAQALRAQTAGDPAPSRTDEFTQRGAEGVEQ
jgi:quinohemoprotein ethanol dehydrogenase